MSEVRLAEVFSNSSVSAFGKALKWALTPKDYGGADDYASLVELEYVESKEEFAETLKKFLRRYHSYARRREKEKKPVFIPAEKDLISLTKLIDNLGDSGVNGVKLVRAALISHALVKAAKTGCCSIKNEI